MSDDYARVSRSTTVASLVPALSVEVLRVAAEQGAGDVSRSAAVETRSTRTRAGGFFARMMGTADPDTEHWTCVVVTRGAVLVGVHGGKRGTRVFFLPLATLELGQALGGGRSIAFRSPSLGTADARVGSYSVYFGDDATRASVHAEVLAALETLRR